MVQAVKTTSLRNYYRIPSKLTNHSKSCTTGFSGTVVGMILQRHDIIDRYNPMTIVHRRYLGCICNSVAITKWTIHAPVDYFCPTFHSPGIISVFVKTTVAHCNIATVSNRYHNNNRYLHDGISAAIDGCMARR